MISREIYVKKLEEIGEEADTSYGTLPMLLCVIKMLVIIAYILLDIAEKITNNDS